MALPFSLFPSVLIVAVICLCFTPYNALGQTCVPVEPENTSLLCPGLENMTRPLTPLLFNNTVQVLPDLPEFYEMISEVVCKDCNGFLKKSFVCSLIFMYYTKIGRCPTTGLSQALPCLTDCETAEGRCRKRLEAQGNYTDTIVCPKTQPNPLNDNAGCGKNRNGDFCNRPPFLLRKSAGAPNWVWIFIVGLGGLILLIIIAAVVIMCLKLDTFMTVINPCKWCECCPGYYDL